MCFIGALLFFSFLSSSFVALLLKKEKDGFVCAGTGVGGLDGVDKEKH